MRITSDLWVAAAIRRVFGAGGYAAVERRGATEAGAIFVIARRRDGLCDLYGPAPQTDYEEARPQERMFAPILPDAEPGAVEDKLARELRFDPDIWVVEIEASAELIETLMPISR